MSDKRNTIVITGFGPFGQNAVNDSWICADLLSKSDLIDELDIDIISVPLEVSYKDVEEKVSSLWTEYKPFMMIHLGIHPQDEIAIEKCARKVGYCKFDNNNCFPENSQCPFGEIDIIETAFDIKKIISKVDPKCFNVVQSFNAGLYVCEYVYYVSLSFDPTRTLFIHLPSSYITGLYPPEEKVPVLKDIIKETYLLRLLMD